MPTSRLGKRRHAADTYERYVAANVHAVVRLLPAGCGIFGGRSMQGPPPGEDFPPPVAGAAPPILRFTGASLFGGVHVLIGREKRGCLGCRH